MADQAGVLVHRNMFIVRQPHMAGRAPQVNALAQLVKIPPMRGVLEFDLIFKHYLRIYDLFLDMAAAPQTGSVAYLGEHPFGISAGYMVDDLDEPVYLAFNMRSQTRLVVALEAIDVLMDRLFPSLVIRFHFMATAAKRGTLGIDHRGDRYRYEQGRGSA